MEMEWKWNLKMLYDKRITDSNIVLIISFDSVPIMKNFSLFKEYNLLSYYVLSPSGHVIFQDFIPLLTMKHKYYRDQDILSQSTMINKNDNHFDHPVLPRSGHIVTEYNDKQE